MSGVAPPTPTITNTPLVGLQEGNLRYWLLVAAASALDLMLRVPCEFLPISRDATPYAARLEDGQRSA